MMANSKTSQDQYRTLRQYLKGGDGEPQHTVKERLVVQLKGSGSGPLQGSRAQVKQRQVRRQLKTNLHLHLNRPIKLLRSITLAFLLARTFITQQVANGLYVALNSFPCM